jgi:lipoprotein-anchoring transpeptidase ErfK/SrfK
MQRPVLPAVISALLATSPALSNPLPIEPQHGPGALQADAPLVAIFEAPRPAAPPQRYAQAPGPLGGGFIEALFGGLQNAQPRYAPAPPPVQQYDPAALAPYRYRERPAPYYPAPDVHEQQASYPPARPARREIDPRFLPQEVDYDGKEKPGTIIINTPERHLYLVMEDGKARRYGIGVGRPGFTWAGVKTVSQKKEWPDWRPPKEMLQRQPHLPRYMPGGPDNPLGARALYLGSSLYRIHGSNEPWTIGQAVSSGCIRMRNEDVIDLYNRVDVGTKVVVI